MEEYIGEKYNHLTIVGIDRERRKREKSCNTYVFADCDCGIKNKSYNLAKIKRGETKSCGHLKMMKHGCYKNNKIECFDDYGVIFTNNKNLNKFYFDLEDKHLLENKYWYEDDYGYLTNCEVVDGKNVYTRFHRIVMNAKTSDFVDHKNRKKYDNRKENLRICTHQENDRNKDISSKNRSGIIGVGWDKSRSKWSSSITINHKKIFLGRFSDKNEAIKNRLLAEKKYFKDFAPQKHLYKEYGL